MPRNSPKCANSLIADRESDGLAANSLNVFFNFGSERTNCGQSFIHLCAATVRRVYRFSER